MTVRVEVLIFWVGSSYDHLMEKMTDLLTDCFTMQGTGIEIEMIKIGAQTAEIK